MYLWIFVLLTLLAGCAQDANALYLNEIFLFKNSSMRLSRSFNITLTKQYTIPSRLRQSSMCQVPDFQLADFNNRTSNKYLVEDNKRGTKEDGVACPSTETCKGVDALMIAGICIGTKHTVVTSKCLENVYTKIQELIKNAQTSAEGYAANAAATAQTNAQIYADAQIAIAQIESMSFTTNLVNSEIAGMNKTFLNVLGSLNETLTSQLLAQEIATAYAISNSSARLTRTFTNNLDVLRNATSVQLANLQASTDRKMSNLVADMNAQDAAILAKTSNSLGTSVADLNAKINVLNSLLATTVFSSSMAANNRMSYISNYLENFIDGYNRNNMRMVANHLAILDAIQQLAIREEVSARYKMEGADISSLLGKWQESDLTTVFQDNTTNTYKYVVQGMIGVYDKDEASIDYPSEKTVVGKYAYLCQARNAQDLRPYQSSSRISFEVSVNISKNFGDPLGTYLPTSDIYSLASRLIGKYCAAGDATQFEYLISTSIGNFRAYPCAAEPADLCIEYSTIRWTMHYTGTGIECSRTALTGEQASSTKNRRDSGIFTTNMPVADSNVGVYFVDSDPYSKLLSVTKDVVTVTNKVPSSRTLLSGISFNSGQYSYQQFHTVYSESYVETKFGDSHFTFLHPTLGTMVAESCVRARAGTHGDMLPGLLSTDFWQADDMGKVLDARVNSMSPGSLFVNTVSSFSSQLQMIARQQGSTGSVYGLEADKFYYAADVWCCDKLGVPVRSGLNTTVCVRLSLQVCDSAMFGVCARGQSSNEAMLTLPNNLCPSGYTPTPLRSYPKYKAPRMYYCSGSVKYKSPYGVEVTYCEGGNIRLPGAGVVIQTGTMAPGGLYPADCLYWNTVHGRVPVYNVRTEFEDMIVPTMLNDLNNKRVAYAYDQGTVIDEMDRLYGLQNSGYDCVAYEMDKLYHDPRNCLNYDMPSYNVSAYFSGKVRSTGLSSLSPYFNIRPISLNNSDSLIINFELREGIDYEAAYIDEVNSCPTLQVTYLSYPPRCALSGWPAIGKVGVVVTVAGREVCNSLGYCDSGISVPDGAELYVGVNDHGTITNCSRFVCMASSATFVAYPVDTFSLHLQRPNELEYIPGLRNISFVSDIENLHNSLEHIQERLTNYSVGVEKNISAVIEKMGLYTNISDILAKLVAGDINTTIVVEYQIPNLTSVFEELSANYAAIIRNVNSSFANMKTNVSADMEILVAENNRKFNESAVAVNARTEKSIAELRANFSTLLEEYRSKMSAPANKSELVFTDDKDKSGIGKLKFMSLGGLISWNVVNLIIACAAAGLSVYNFYIARSVPKMVSVNSGL